MEVMLTIQEVIDMLMLLPKDKSLQIDGLTCEVFIACWEFVKLEFYKMICDFWVNETPIARCYER